MPLKKRRFEIALVNQGNQHTCDKAEIKRKLMELVRLLAKDAAQQSYREGALS